jgi:hypothetical protein
MPLPEIFQIGFSLHGWEYAGCQEKWAYDPAIAGRVLYAGQAQLGAATSDGAWTIAKFYYDADGNVTDVKYSRRNQIWDDRVAYFLAYD